MSPKRYPTTEEKRLQVRRKLDQLISALGWRTEVRLVPNPMLAGPCEACLKVASAVHFARRAPLPPFDNCPHPDQCACMYRLHSYSLE